MGDQYYDSQLTAAQIDSVLNAVSNVIIPANNGKILVVDQGVLIAKSATDYIRQPTLGEKVITENGTYSANDDSLDGYDRVIVNTPTGGIPLLTSDHWRALSTAEKQAYGYVGLLKKAEGFLRGDLIYGADYQEIGVYLPYSDPEKIICEAFYDNYDNSLRWGTGTNPVIFTKSPTVETLEQDIYIRTASTGEIGYVDLGESNTTFTAYLVARVPASTGYTRVISATYAHSAHHGPMIHNGLNLSKWGDNILLGADGTSWFAAALQCNGGNAPYYGAAYNGANVPQIKTTGSPAAVGRYLTLARTDIGTELNQEPNDMRVRYLGVTRAADTAENIIANLQHLYQQLCV